MYYTSDKVRSHTHTHTHTHTLVHLLVHGSFAIITIDKEGMELDLTHLQGLPHSFKTPSSRCWRTNDFKASFKDGVVQSNLQSGRS